MKNKHKLSNIVITVLTILVIILVGIKITEPTILIPPEENKSKQLILLDITYTHNTVSRAFSFFNASNETPDNLVFPINYSTGKIYQRLEVLSKPSTKPVSYQVCIFQDKIISEKHTCSGYMKFTTTGTYYSNQTMQSLYQYNVIDWKRKLLSVMLVVKDANGKPIDDRYGFAGFWSGSPNYSLYYPMTVRYTVILVPKGESPPIFNN